LMETINKWRWNPVDPCDPETARRIGGAFFEFLFDRKTTLQPQSPEERTYFGLLQKRFAALGGSITVTPDEIAITLRLLQSATLTKKQIRDESGQLSITFASDNALEEFYLLLESISDDKFIHDLDQILGKPQSTIS